jgi:hypothetical protein
MAAQTDHRRYDVSSLPPIELEKRHHDSSRLILWQGIIVFFIRGTTLKMPGDCPSNLVERWSLTSLALSYRDRGFQQ